MKSPKYHKYTVCRVSKFGMLPVVLDKHLLFGYLGTWTLGRGLGSVPRYLVHDGEDNGAENPLKLGALLETHDLRTT